MSSDAERRPAELRDVLREAAAAVIVDRGLGSFSIREVARRAGVSHAAPGYHFGDTRGLLTALAIEGFEHLYNEMAASAATTEDPIERLTEIGRAYIRVALRFPAHCEVIFREDLIDVLDPAYDAAGLSAFGVLEGTIGEIAARHNPALDVLDASKLCWSAMQGLVQILPKLARIDALQRGAAETAEDTVARFTSLFIAGFLRPPGS